MELNIRYDFMKYRTVAYAISLIAFVGTVFLYVSPGLRYGVDFAGGTILHLRFNADLEDKTVREILSQDLKLSDVTIQSAEAVTDATSGGAAKLGASREKVIRTVFLSGKAGVPNTKEFKEALERGLATRGVKNAKGEPAKIESTLAEESVGPSVSGELRNQALYATFISCILILIYVTIQFEFAFAVPAVLALVHDAVITIGFLIVTGFEMNMVTLAVILTLIGYSINDSIVVCDRVRENLKIMKKMKYRDLVNVSLNQTLSRTILTGATTILPLVTMALFGGEVLKSFALPMIFGIVIGTFSSIYVVSALIVDWKSRVETSRA